MKQATLFEGNDKVVDLSAAKKKAAEMKQKTQEILKGERSTQIFIDKFETVYRLFLF